MEVIALFGPIGLPEMLIILAIVILIFGANRLPELGPRHRCRHQELQDLDQETTTRTTSASQQHARRRPLAA